jgi:hypothetical protein
MLQTLFLLQITGFTLHGAFVVYQDYFFPFEYFYCFAVTV